MLFSYIQSSIAESSESQINDNNEVENACNNTDDLHQLFMYPQKERLHNQNIIQEMTESCNISNVNLYAGAKEVNNNSITCTTPTQSPHTHHTSTHTHTPSNTPPPHTHPHIHPYIYK